MYLLLVCVQNFPLAVCLSQYVCDLYARSSVSHQLISSFFIWYQQFNCIFVNALLWWFQLLAFYLSLEPGHVCPFQNDGILLILCQACSLSSPHGGVSDGNHISSFGPSLTRNFYTTCGGLIKKKKKNFLSSSVCLKMSAVSLKPAFSWWVWRKSSPEFSCSTNPFYSPSNSFMCYCTHWTSF